jgi:predicted GNAT family acetyltransferase
MELRAHTSADSFLHAAGELLLRDEARHNLIFGICATLREAPEAHPEFHLWSVERGGTAVAAALMTPPFNLVVAQPADDAALQFAARALAAERVSPPGLTGTRPEVEVFKDAWESSTGARSRLRMAQGVYAVREARPPDGVSGEMRFAEASDRQLLVDWTLAFGAEAIPEDAPHQNAEEFIDRRLASDTGGYALWDDGGETVSMSGHGGRTPHGIRIGPVYTPPELRRRGYASALVGQQSRYLLEGGLDYCFLYTDLANPTSNRVYMNVGYELVCESADYAFEK